MEKIVNSFCRKLKKQHKINHLAVVLIFFSVLVMMILLCLHFELIGITLASDIDSGEEETEQTESVSFIAEDDGVIVSVIAPEGALPEGAILSVTLIDCDSEDYAAIAEAVGFEEDADISVASEGDAKEAETETEETVSSLAVLDITFTSDGVEVEPSCEVSVIIDASSLMTEDADASTLEVMHLEESSEGITPVLVADATDNTEGTVDTENAVASFTVDSFSTFTLTWTAYTGRLGSYKAEIVVNVYTLEDDSSAPVEITDATSAYSIDTGNTTITIEELVNSISGTSLTGYDYYYAAIDTVGNSTDSVTSVYISYSLSGRLNNYCTFSSKIYTTSNQTTGTDGPTASLSWPSNTTKSEYITINLYYLKSEAKTASLTINKYEKDKNTQLSGATFTLESTDADLSYVTAGSVVFDSQTSDSITFTTTDTAITFDNLPEGTYTLTETDAPTGYNTADNVSFTVANGKVTYNGDTVTEITIEDEPKTVILTVTKIYVNADGTEITGEDLSSLKASFTLTASDGTTFTGTTTGDGGTWEVGKLTDGTYTLTETDVPDGYDKSDDITITIEDGKIYVGGLEVSTVTVTNKKNITLTVVKNYVSSNGNTIDVSADDDAVATFTLESTGNTDAYSESVIITGAGSGTFTGLAYNGTYTLSESMTSTYYTTADDVTITVINGTIYVGDADERNEADTVYMTNTDENHPLAGMSYAIANLNSSQKYALTTTAGSSGGLAGESVTVVGTDTDGTTIIYGASVIWTFEAVAGETNTYYIYTTNDNGEKIYLNISEGSRVENGITVSTTAQAITLTQGEGSETHKTQYRFTVGSDNTVTALNWYGGSNPNNLVFGAYNGGITKDNECMTLCKVVETSGSLLLYNLNTSSLSLDKSSNSGWYISSYTTEGDLTWTATSGTDDDLTSTSTIQVVSSEDNLTTILGKGVNGYYTYVSGQRLSLAKQMISDGKSPGKEFRFDYWTATDVNSDTCYFAEDATISSIDTDGNIIIKDIDGVKRTLASGTTLTAHWTEVSDIVMFFVNYSGTVLDIEGNVSGRNQQQFTGIVAIGHIYFGTVTVGSDSTFAADADTKIRSYFAYEPSYTDATEIVIDYATIYENGKTTVYNLAEGINDSILDEYLLAYIRNSGITIKISTADGDNPAIENENATTENYTVRWYVVKQQVDGWHIDGVMVANTSEMTVTKTFSGLTEDEVNYILGLDTGNTNSAPFNIPILLGEDKQTYVTMYAADPTDNNGVTANGVYDYDGKESDILSYQWTVHTITNEEYTLYEQDYTLDGYDVATVAVHYYLDENGEEQYESAYTTTSAYLTTQILGGTSTGFSFNNFYTKSDTGMLMIVKTDGNGLNLNGAEFTLTDDLGASVEKITTNANGLAFFNGLKEGTYYLTETGAPDGYQHSDTTWKVVVTDDAGNITVTIYESDYAGYYYGDTGYNGSDKGTLCYSSSSSYIYNYEIENETEDTTVTITKTFGGELTYAQLQEIYEASTSDNDLATNPSGSSYSRYPYYVKLTNGSETKTLYLQDATRTQSGFSFTWTLSNIDPSDTWTIYEYNYIYAKYIDTTVVATVDGTTTPTVTIEESGTDRYAWFETTFSDNASDTVLITNTYTNYFTLSLMKVDSETNEPLQGAEFKIYGAYSEATDVDDQIIYTDGTGTTQTLYYINTITSDAKGLATISGLRLSDATNTFAYVLNESTAPSGYVLSTDVTVITVSIDSSNYDTGVYSVEIPNSKTTSVLPETGDVGWLLLYVLGGAMIFASMMLLLKRRKEKILS